MCFAPTTLLSSSSPLVHGRQERVWLRETGSERGVGSHNLIIRFKVEIKLMGVVTRSELERSSIVS